jgi:hypothetical protein
MLQRSYCEHLIPHSFQTLSGQEGRDGARDRFRNYQEQCIKKHILATSDDEIVYNFPAGVTNLRSGLAGMLSIFGNAGLESLQIHASVITPSLLVSGIELKKSRGNFPKLPIVSSPIQ